MEKIISKFQTSISWSKERWRSYICIPSGAQAHMMTHTKREPHGQLRDPFLCRKTILETFKSFSISDYYKFVFLHIPLINRCSVIKDFTGWVSDFWLTIYCLKKIAEHFRKNPSETLVNKDCVTWPLVTAPGGHLHGQWLTSPSLTPPLPSLLPVPGEGEGVRVGEALVRTVLLEGVSLSSYS